MFSFVSASLFAQTELQKFDENLNNSIIISKKQAAFQGQIPESSTTITYINPAITTEEGLLIEEVIKNYKLNGNNSNTIVLTDNDALNSESSTVGSAKVPLSQFNSFSINIQQYIIFNREFYEPYIKFD